MANQKTFPPISKELLDELKSRYPNKVPTSKKHSYDDFRFLQGQISVIEFLEHQFNLQNMTVLGHTDG